MPGAIILTYEAFDDHIRGKTWEIHGHTPKYRDIVSGDPLILKRGMNKFPEIRGTAGRVIIRLTLDDIFRDIDFRLAEPKAKSVSEAINGNMKLLGEKEAYMAIELLNPMYRVM